MPREKLLGGAYTAQALIADAQRCVNLYPEKNPEQAPVPVTLYPRPGLTPLSSPPTIGQARCLYRATNGDLYAVLDTAVYYINPDWQWTYIGSMATALTTPVMMADNGTNIIVVDGTPNGYTILMTTRVFGQTGDPNFLGSDRADFLDGFLIFNDPGTQNWYCSLSYSVSFNALFFGTKTAWPDDIIAVMAVEREAWIFGPQKSEVWTNNGTVPFPFQPLPGIIVEHGCAAKYSVAKQDVNIYWLSQSPEGARMVMKGADHQAKRISNHAIEAEFLKYPRVDDAIGAVYQIAGHAFYKLHFPTADKTWGYDEATGQWHEDLSIDSNGNFHRALNTFCAYAYGTNVALDWRNGNLLKIDPSNFTDADEPIVCLRSFPHNMDGEGDRVTYWQFTADMETGTGTGTAEVPTTSTPWSLGFSAGFGARVVTEPPLVSLRCSRTRGYSWENAVTQPMGAAGKYLCRPSWNRLGYTTDMVFELSWSTPMKTALNGGFVVFERSEGDE